MDSINLYDAFKSELIDITDSEFKDKDEIFAHMANMFFKSGFVSDVEEYKKALYEREDTGSTYMGDYLAVPHGKCAAVKKAAIAICRSKPFIYTSNDFSGEVKLTVMLAIPEQSDSNEYVRMLSTMTRLLMDKEFMDVLFNSDDVEKITKVAITQAGKLKSLS